MNFGWRVLILTAGAMLTIGASTWAVPLKIMTFNIRGDFDLEAVSNSPEAWNSISNRHRRDLVAKTVSDAAPDIFGVQEAFRHQLVDLKRALSSYEYYGVGRDDGNSAGENSAIFYRADRFRRLSQGTFWLSNAPAEVGSKYPDAACVRIASWVVLEDGAVGGKEYFVLNTHWDHVSDAARLHSAKVIRNRIDELASDRSILVIGDMNVDEDHSAIATLCGKDDSAGRRLVDSFREMVPHRGKNEATFHNFGGNPEGSRIDYIFHSADLCATSAAIIRGKFDDRYPSDHFPVTANFVSTENAAGGGVFTTPR